MNASKSSDLTRRVNRTLHSFALRHGDTMRRGDPNKRTLHAPLLLLACIVVWKSTSVGEKFHGSVDLKVSVMLRLALCRSSSQLLLERCSNKGIV